VTERTDTPTVYEKNCAGVWDAIHLTLTTMKYRHQQENYIIRIEPHEKLKKELSVFAQAVNITGAYFSGIGATAKAEVGMFDPENEEYSFQTFDEQMEITNVVGNITTNDDTVDIHAHITLADESQQAFGGHLQEALIYPTCEIRLTETEPIHRSHNSEVGLDLIDLGYSHE